MSTNTLTTLSTTVIALSFAAVGCLNAESDRVVTDSHTQTIFASSATTDATGIVEWELVQSGDSLRTIGVDERGAVLSDSTMRLDGDAVAISVSLPEPGALRFTAAGVVAENTLSAETITIVQAFSADAEPLQQSSEYGFWGCLSSSIGAGVACGVAIGQGGANLYADGLCLSLVGKMIDVCAE